MKLSTTRRRLLAGMLTLSLLLSLSGLAATPDNEFRVFRIHGRRVHLRQGIPAQLNHIGIVRHLDESHVLIADRIGTGIGHTGRGTDRWLHVIDLQSGDCGWVNEHFVEQLAGPAFDESPMPSPTIVDEPPVIAPTIHDMPPTDMPRDDWRTLLTTIAAVATVISALTNLEVLRQTRRPPPRRRPTVRRSAPRIPPTVLRPNSPPATSGTSSHTPHFIYGVAGGVPYRIPTAKP